MSGDWLPVLIVLGVGTLAGLWIAWRMRRSALGASSEERAADVSLELADLERRKRELYERLEREEEPEDRELLEEQAAWVLREIDRLRGEVPAETASEAAHAVAAPSLDRPATAPSASGRSMLIGFLGGAAMVALVAVLVFWAGEDARPREGAVETPAMGMEDDEHPSPAMTADVAARIQTLRERVEADPSDVVAHKQLALALLAAEQFFEAFEVSQSILASRPDDPDGLYVQGMVRLTMGQDEVALELLERVLEQYPNHILALAGRGMIFLRRGDREAAILVWERALEAAGGEHPDIEGLLEMARSEPTAPMPAVTPPTTETAGTAAETGSAAAAESVAGDAYGVRIEMAPGRAAAPSSTLFVFLRDAAAGPPSAVKRIQAPVFPLEVSLGSGDSMMGRPLPESGVITARLDADGSASTESEDDLVAEVEGRMGERVRLVLGE